MSMNSTWAHINIMYDTGMNPTDSDIREFALVWPLLKGISQLLGKPECLIFAFYFSSPVCLLPPELSYTAFLDNNLYNLCKSMWRELPSLFYNEKVQSWRGYS